jgi:type I restriction enzyme, S subunit
VISALRPYPAYRDSGVDWLGEVPEAWGVRRLGSVTTPVSRRGRPDLPLLSVLRERGVVLREQGDGNHNVIPDDLTNYKVVNPGELVINKMKAWQGSLGVAATSGIVSPAYFVFHLHEIGRPYAHLLLRSEPYIGAFAAASNGIRVDQWDLSIVGMKAVPVLIPTQSEQSTIARFLNYADGRIQRFIATKERLIDLLEEEKRAVIGSVISRGLDGEVPFKSTGFDAFSELPEHWHIGPLRRFCSVVDCKHLTVPPVESGIPVASVREVRSFDLDLSSAKRVSEASYRALLEGGRRPSRGDLIYCRNVSVGASAYVDADVDFALGQDVCLIRPRQENGRFINYVMHSAGMRRQLSEKLIGSTFNRVNISDIKTFVLPIPPRLEQDKIVQRLDNRLRRFERLSVRATRHVALIREYRARLISDVVTGKLDVREAAAKLPADPDADHAALDEQLEEVAAE